MDGLRLFGLIVLVCFSMTAHAGTEALLGILEEPQCKEGGVIHVRPLFMKNDASWQTLNTREASAGHLPKRINWVVSFDGKKIGDVETDDPGFSTNYEWTYPRDRLLNVVSTNSYSPVPNRGNNFEGWCAAPKSRPLVVVANGSVLDPDGWKPFSPPQELVGRLFSEFKARLGAPFICPNPDAEKGVRFKYGAKDVHLLKGYKSNRGQLLITLALKPRKDRCDGPDDGWNTQTFLVDSNTGYVGAGVNLVDAGDYDGDGTSELLFWFSGYNKDGYVLFSPTTGGRREFLWHYH
jgi:hypothetical protein